MRRLVVVRHAPTASTRSSIFASPDEPLDERGRGAAGAVPLRARGAVLSSPARCCLETAAACAGLPEPTVVAALAECDHGSWIGRTLEEVEPAALRAWRTDPDAAPHGGESLRAFAGRVAAWLDDQAQSDGVTLAITHAGVVRAAVVHALGAPLEAFWRIDVAPLSLTELHARDGHWTLTRANGAAA